MVQIAICREILTNLIDGCRTLGINQDSIPHWEAQLASLPTYLLDLDGGHVRYTFKAGEKAQIEIIF